MKITAEFVTSAAGAHDFPRDGLPEVAMVGRSNVGKSSLINALVRQRLARTSAAPGKTRLANLYWIARGTGAPFYLVDLPGFGYARGGHDSAREFEALTRAYFGQVRQVGQERQARQVGTRQRISPLALPDPPASPGLVSGLLLVDTRHPGLETDIEAWNWLKSAASGCAVVGTKIDKLARGQRIRAQRELESAFEDSVLPVSAVTGEGLDELWKLIDRLANNRNSREPRRGTKAAGR